MIETEGNEAVWSIYNNQLKALAEKNLKEPLSNELKRFYLKYLATSLNNQSISFEIHGDIKKAISYQERSLTIQEQIQNKQGIATSLQNIGATYFDQGNILIALNYYKKSLKIQQEINDKKGMAASFHNFAVIYKDQGDNTKALEYFFKSLNIEKEINNKSGIPATLKFIGEVYENSGELEEALEYFEKSLIIGQEIGSYTSEASAYYCLGRIKQKQGDLTNAILFFKKGLDISEKANDVSQMCPGLTSLGTIYFKQKDYELALDYSIKSLTIAVESGYTSYIISSAMLLKNIYKELNQPTKSLEMLELYTKTYEKSINNETKKGIITSQLKYEYELKANEEKRKTDEEKKLSVIQQKQEKTQRFFLYGFLALALLFSVFIFNRFRITRKQKLIIEEQKDVVEKQKTLVEEKQKEILDSIHYAKRIQSALIAQEPILKSHLNDHLVLFKPKDIVSGDFYWATEHQNKFYLAACDSTGHGVPGAFMSLLNMGFLSEAIKEKNISAPNEVFDFIRTRLINSIGNDGQQDGMDAILICIDKSTHTITYSAANNAPILIRENQVIDLPKDKMPVGKGEKTDNFNLYSIDLKKGDCLYLYTDGYADQFGGPKGKKFKYKTLNELLVSISNDPVKDQQNKLATVFENWKGELEQVDDVLIIGIKI